MMRLEFYVDTEGNPPGSLELTQEDAMQMTMNSLERVFNLAIDVCKYSTHRDAMTAEDDLKELKRLACGVWFGATNALIDKAWNK